MNIFFKVNVSDTMYEKLFKMLIRNGIKIPEQIQDGAVIPVDLEKIIEAMGFDVDMVISIAEVQMKMYKK